MVFVVIALIEEARKSVSPALEAGENSVVELASLAELPAVLREVPVSGILLELITSTKATPQEKQDTFDLIQLYPHAKFRVTGKEAVILGKEMSLEKFVQDCRSFKPRTIRKSPRKTRHIAFLLSADCAFADAEKVVSLNISDGGCFLYSTREWREGDRVWMRFIDNDVVISGIVRWWQPWGNNRMMPGIGVKLDSGDDKVQ